MPIIKKMKLKEKLWEEISNNLLDFAESLPKAKKGVIRWLQNARINSKISTNQKPVNVQLDLHCVWICKVLPIEVFEDGIDDLVELLINRKSKKFLFPILKQAKEIRLELQYLKNEVHGWRTGPLGIIDFDDDKSNEYLDYIDIQYKALRGEHVELIFCLFPNALYRRKIQEILEMEYSDYTTINAPKLANVLKGRWGAMSIPGERKKLRDIQELIIDFKNSAKKILRKNTSGALFNDSQMPPSIELWIKEESVQGLEAINKDARSTFWSSIGFNEHSIEKYEEESGTYSLFMPENDLGDFSIKILAAQNRIQLAGGFREVGTQVQNHVNYWIPALFSFFAVRVILLDLIDDLNSIRLQIYSRKPHTAQTLFKWISYVFNQEVQLKRLQEVFLSKDVRIILANSGIPDLKNKLGNNPISKLNDNLIANQEYLFNKARDFLNSIQATIKTSVEIISIKTNYRTQVYMLFLSILMAIIGFISITTGTRACETNIAKPICNKINTLLSAD